MITFQKEKQIEWLINSGCLKETSESLQVKRCLLRSGLGEDRALCKTMKQMTDCVMDSIISSCRVPEVKFFERIYDGLHVRSSFCTPSEGPSLGRFSTSVRDKNANQRSEEEEDDEEESEGDDESSSGGTAIFSNGMTSFLNMISKIQHFSYMDHFRMSACETTSFNKR